MTKLPGYNHTPIEEGLQGTAQTPYLNRRGAASQKQSGKFSNGTARGDDIIHNRDMETVDRQFKAKGIFEVSFAQPGAELMLDGGSMNSCKRAGLIPTSEPPREGTADQVALVIAAPPVPTSV
ncbi:hypothetical protein EAI6_38190 [Enterobacter asburiae]|nr:hypothetical protein EAI6_38190 [Enterobacter asburiae]